jgi:hypothetical protein
MAQDPSFARGALFKNDVGGEIISAETITNIDERQVAAAALINSNSLIDVTRLKMAIVSEPNDYRRLPDHAKRSVVSPVIVTDIDGTVSTTTMNISLYFQRNIGSQSTAAQYYCSFWNKTTDEWSESGCTNPPTFNTRFSRYECNCNHLTSFALLWLPRSSSSTKLNAEDISSIIFQLISILCFLAICIHLFVTRIIDPTVQLNAAVLHALLSSASTAILFVFYLALGLSVYTWHESSILGIATTCRPAASVLMFIVYFLLICMFCTKTSIVCYNCWNLVDNLEKPSMDRQNHPLHEHMPSLNPLKYLLFTALILSSVLVALAAGLNSNAHLHIIELYQGKLCWFSPTVNHYFLTIPIALFILINIIMILIYARVSCKLVSWSTQQLDYEKPEKRKILFVLISSCVTQSIGWIFGPIAGSVSGTVVLVFSWVFNICNALEGLWTILLYMFIRQQRIARAKAMYAPVHKTKAAQICYILPRKDSGRDNDDIQLQKVRHADNRGVKQTRTPWKKQDESKQVRYSQRTATKKDHTNLNPQQVHSPLLKTPENCNLKPYRNARNGSDTIDDIECVRL